MHSTSATTTELLRALADAVPFVLIGTAALARLHPVALRDYVLPDRDILLRPDALVPFVRRAQALGFAVTCWGQPWEAGWTAQDVAGRWYVRADRGALRIDATFECPFIDVDSAHAQARIIDGVPVCPEVQIWRLKWIKDPAACRAFAERFRLKIPPESTGILSATEEEC